jgi:predicted MFS family arabinose efflux permease
VNEARFHLKTSLRFQILIFTLIRVVLNTMHRMVYPFLAVFGRGLGVDLPSLALAVTARSLGGTVGPFLASVADSHGRKIGMLLGLSLFSLGTGLVVFWPTYPVFVLTLALTMLGKYVFDPSMQAYLGDRVPYQRRGRAIAITEYGWSLSFILGIPLMGFIIARLGWVAPFPLLCLLGLISLLTLAWMLPRDPAIERGRPKFWINLRAVFSSIPALLGLTVGLFISASNEVINLVFGVWLEDSFGLQIAALGVASAVIGLSELGGETLTAGFTDRLGKANAVVLGLLANCLAALVLPLAGRSLPGALVGLFFFYISFEFTIVSNIPLMTEIFPSARATLMAANIAAHSLGRALGALLAPALYLQGQGLAQLPPLMVSSLVTILLNLVALAALYFLRRRIL